MECVLEANPVPDITWYQGTKTITDTNRVKMSRKATGKDTYLLTLEISNPTKEDGGNYRCNAFNSFGESNANISLNFQGESFVSDFEIFSSSIVSFRFVSFLFQEGTKRDTLRPSSTNPESFQTIPVHWSPWNANAKRNRDPTSRGTEAPRQSKNPRKLKWKPSTKATKFTSSCSKFRYARAQRDFLFLSVPKIENRFFFSSQDPGSADGGTYRCHAKNEFGESNANLNLNIEADQEPDGKEPVFVEKPRIVSEQVRIYKNSIFPLFFFLFFFWRP